MKLFLADSLFSFLDRIVHPLQCPWYPWQFFGKTLENLLVLSMILENLLVALARSLDSLTKLLSSLVKTYDDPWKSLGALLKVLGFLGKYA